MSEEKTELDPEELEGEAGEPLPDREAMSLVSVWPEPDPIPFPDEAPPAAEPESDLETIPNREPVKGG